MLGLFCIPFITCGKLGTMKSHAAKPIIVGLFMFVLLAFIAIILMNQAPQASEITPTSGESEPLPVCSDGKDNDNDGTIDWPGYNTATGDSGCASPRDETEDNDTDQ